MNGRLANMLTRFYPAWWRRRYAAEFRAFLEGDTGGIRSVADVLWSALREHIVSEGESQMNRSQRNLGLVVVSFLAAVAGGINLVMTVDDSALIAAMRSHLDIGIAWNAVAAAAILCGIGVLAIAIPLYRSMLSYARKQHRRDILALLAVPFLGIGILVLWGGAGVAFTGGRWAPSPWAILAEGSAPLFWPSLPVRWICGIISVALCAAVAISSAISMQQAIRRTDFEPSHRADLRGQSRSAIAASLLVTGCTLVMSLSVLLWGVFIERDAPAIFHQRFGLLDGTAADSWAISLCLFVLASIFSIRGSQSLRGTETADSL
jgi:hypothetical protein